MSQYSIIEFDQKGCYKEESTISNYTELKDTIIKWIEDASNRVTVHDNNSWKIINGIEEDFFAEKGLWFAYGIAMTGGDIHDGDVWYINDSSIHLFKDLEKTLFEFLSAHDLSDIKDLMPNDASFESIEKCIKNHKLDISLIDALSKDEIQQLSENMSNACDDQPPIAILGDCFNLMKTHDIITFPTMVRTVSLDTSDASENTDVDVLSFIYQED